MVEVVLEEVVFRKICEVTLLYRREERNVGGIGRDWHDVDHFEVGVDGRLPD